MFENCSISLNLTLISLGTVATSVKRLIYTVGRVNTGLAPNCPNSSWKKGSSFLPDDLGKSVLIHTLNKPKGEACKLFYYNFEIF